MKNKEAKMMTNQEAIKILENLKQGMINLSRTPAYLTEEERQHSICLIIEVYRKAIEALRQTT